MIISFVLLLIMIILVNNSSLVYLGAASGLMLWYNNVLPFILPFMLIANYLVYNSLTNEKINKSDSSVAPILTIILGCMCGCPVGARCTAIYTNNNRYPIALGNIILPLCNNFSPIFISGYIACKILNSRIPLSNIFFILYFPYAILLLFRLSIYKIVEKHKCSKNKTFNTQPHQHHPEYKPADSSIIYSTICQTTCVGVYIMLCSIIIYFIQSTNLSDSYKLFFSGLTEVTNGTKLFINSTILSQEKKIALILSFTSFGGLSSILQTKSVISDSKLSIIQYIMSKTVCAAMTYFLSIMLI